MSSSPRTTLDFVLNGEPVSFSPRDPTQTLLTWLREERRLVGTKEGCAEGDCGACTVAIAERDASGNLGYVPVNSCILPIGALDGRELISVEGLKPIYDGALHPAQRAMVDKHGSQCGFCTPGFVMALYAHYKCGGSADRLAVCDSIAGNLCRCTGYRSIVAAGESMARLADGARDAGEDTARLARLAALPAGPVMLEGAGKSFFIPSTAVELGQYLFENPQAVILGGGTDLGLAITKGHRDFPCVVYTGRVGDMREIRESGGVIEIGGAVTYTEAYASLAALHPDIGELLRRLGSWQIRSSGTLAGNIANASPIGDSMPVLLALGAELVLQFGAKTRVVALAEFYTGYRKTVMAPGEFILAVRVPRIAPDARFAAYKLAKRFDQDISGVCAAFYIEMDAGGIVRSARLGFGGMAATPARAGKAEAVLAGGLWDIGAIARAKGALAQDFVPLSDHRASGDYRLAAAQNLLEKFFIESQPGRPVTRVLEVQP
jgi:xanthine dehydrogenase small subunit